MLAAVLALGARRGGAPIDRTAGGGLGRAGRTLTAGGA